MPPHPLRLQRVSRKDGEIIVTRGQTLGTAARWQLYIMVRYPAATRNQAVKKDTSKTSPYFPWKGGLRSSEYTEVPCSEAFRSDEQVRHGLIANGQSDQRLRKLDWADSIVRKVRFTATTLEDCLFERVVFHECDWSGVTFINCLLRDCLFISGRARSHLVLEGCVVDGLLIAETRVERLEIQRTKVGLMTLHRVVSNGFLFHACDAYRNRGRLCLTEVAVGAIGGLDVLREAGIAVQVDNPLWLALGEQLLKANGIREVAAAEPDEIARVIAEASKLMTG